MLVATAHPAKFADALRPIIGEIELPQALRRYGDQPLRRSELDPELADLRVALA